MIFSLKNKFKTSIESSNQDSSFKDKLFFHDLINHTHGLLLFLTEQELNDNPIKKDDIKFLVNEVKTLQSLIKDHYNYQHKNLHNTQEWISFSFAQNAFISLVNLYLKNASVKFSFEEGLGEKGIFFPVFYRIINNVIKNMSESNAKTIEFNFSVDKNNLIITTINEMTSFEKKNHAEYLEKLILSNELTKNEGLGLESVYSLCQDNGGEFSFEINSHKWINRIKLPLKIHNKSLKSAA